MGHFSDAEHVERFAQKFERASRYILYGKPLKLQPIPPNRARLYRKSVERSFQKQRLPMRDSDLPDLRDSAGNWPEFFVAQPLSFLPPDTFESETGVSREVFNTLSTTIRIGLNEYVTTRLTNHPLHHNTDDSNPYYSESFLVAQNFLDWLSKRTAFNTFMADRKRGHNKALFFENEFFPWLKNEAATPIDRDSDLTWSCQNLLPIAQKYCSKELQLWERSQHKKSLSAAFFRRDLLDLCILGFCKRHQEEMLLLHQEENALHTVSRKDKRTAFLAGLDGVQFACGQMDIPSFIVTSAYEEPPFSEKEIVTAEWLQLFVSFSVIPYSTIGAIHALSHAENPLAVLAGSFLVLFSFGMSWLANAHVQAREKINAVAECNRRIIGTHEIIHEVTTSVFPDEEQCFNWIKVGVVYYLAKIAEDECDESD